MNKSNSLLILVIIGLVVSLFLVKSETSKEISRYQTNIDILNQEVKRSVLKNGDTVVSKQSLVVTGKEFKDQIFIKDSIIGEMARKFKKVQSAVVIETITEIKEIEVPYEVPVPIDFEKKFKYDDQFFKLSGLSNQNGLTDVSLSVPATLRSVVGVKSSFWKHRVTNDVTIDNPNVSVTDLNTQVVDIKKKRFGLGPYIGYDLVKGEFSAGVSANWDLIRF